MRSRCPQSTVGPGSSPRFEQRILVEEVLVRIAREAELGKDDDGGVRLACTLRQCDGVRCVLVRVAEPDEWDADGDPNKPVSIHRIEQGAVHIQAILSSSL